MFLSSVERADAAAARSALEQCRRLADELRAPMLRWRTTVLAGNWALVEGRLADVEAIAQEIGALADSLGLPEGFAHTSVFMKHAWEEDFAQAGHVAADVLARMPSLSFRLCEAWAQAATGQAESARAHIAELSAERYATLPRDYIWLPHMVIVGEIVSALGSAEDAAVVYDFLRPHEAEVAVSYTVTLGPVAHCLAVLAATCGRTDDANGHFAQAAVVARRAEMPAALARTNLAWADLLLRRGRDEDLHHASRLVDETLSLARKLRIDTFERRAAALECALADGSSDAAAATPVPP